MGREHLTGLTSFIFMLDRYLKICRALMHNFTPSVIITAVTRDGSFELEWNLKRTVLATRRVIPGSRVPLGKHIKKPLTIYLVPLIKIMEPFIYSSRMNSDESCGTTSSVTHGRLVCLKSAHRLNIV